MKRITPEARGVWHLRATLTKKAVKGSGDRFFIPSFDTGKTYSSQFIAVGVKVNSSKDNWRYGGYLSQEFKFSSSGYAHSNKAFNRCPELLINEVTILNLPLLSNDNYRLRYSPPTYFSDVRLQIWEYTGIVINDDNGLNAEAYSLLEEINNKLNTSFVDLNNRLDRIERNLSNSSSNNANAQFTTQAPPGRFFFFS